MSLNDSEKIAILVLALLSVSFVFIIGSSSGLEPKDSLDGQQLSNSTTTTIEAAGSYTSQTSRTLSQNERLNQQNVTLRIDLDADRGLRITNQTLDSQAITRIGSRTVYTDGNRSYRRTRIGGNTTYATQTGPRQGLRGIRPVNTTGFGASYAPIVDAFQWEANGTVTVAGVDMIRYTATNVTNSAALTGQSGGDLSNVTGTIWLDRDDVVRKLEIRYEVSANGNTRTVRTELTITDIGSTEVTEPAWISEAQAAANTGSPAPATETPN